jgi:serine/threonine-protein kinase RsbW
VSTESDVDRVGEVPGCGCSARDVLGGVHGAWLWERRAAEPESVIALRRLVRRWTRATVVDEEVGESIVLAVDEAVSNVVEHAYRDGAGDVRVLAVPRPCGDGVAVIVEDQGVWLPPGADPGFRGRGLALMDELSDHYSVAGSGVGTTVRMCWQTLVAD